MNLRPRYWLTPKSKFADIPDMSDVLVMGAPPLESVAVDRAAVVSVAAVWIQSAVPCRGEIRSLVPAWPDKGNDSPYLAWIVGPFAEPSQLSCANDVSARKDAPPKNFLCGILFHNRDTYSSDLMNLSSYPSVRAKSARSRLSLIFAINSISSSFISGKCLVRNFTALLLLSFFLPLSQ